MLKSFLLVIGLSVIIYSQDSTFQKIMRMKDSVSVQNITNHINNLSFAGGYQSRVTFTPGNDSAAVYIKNEFDKIPGLIAYLDTFYVPGAAAPYNVKPQFNVIAEIPGKINPEKQFIVGAHYDCSASRMGTQVWQQQWYTIKAPGADDNATGVASIIEMARLLCDTSIGFVNNHTIKLIAYAAEEYNPTYEGHHLGSIKHAGDAKLNNDQIVGMISVDMVGYNDNYSYTAIVSDAASTFIGQKMIESRSRFNIPVITNNPPFPYANYSDHQSYLDEGYNAVLLIENAPPWNDGIYYTANSYYHKSSDTAATVNMELTARVAQLALVTTASFAAVLSDAADDEFLPGEFYLAQNYPNPFNPVTTIRFNLPEDAAVQLKVYDMLGNETAVLIDGFMRSGIHEEQFDASHLSSGMYIYRLTSDRLSASGKMILIK